MRKPDEIALFAALRVISPGPYKPPGEEAILQAAGDIGIHPKRVATILLKWPWWNYGINVWGGWFEPEAPEELKP